MSIDTSSEWQALARHQKELAGVSMRELFASDGERAANFSVSLGNLLFDFSKNCVTDETLDLLAGLADVADVAGQRERMVDGAPINCTEQRAVLHTALRDRKRKNLIVDGSNIMPQIEHERARVYSFAEAVRGGSIVGATGVAYTDVVNIGIGGSDLGPAMATLALSPFGDGPSIHYVSNVDGAHIADTLTKLDPKTTLFLIASKTFTTTETMTNAATARDWLVAALGDAAVADHFAALSTNQAAVASFGIKPERTFVFWDWVGGRYSLWSAIGLPLVIAIGAKNFDAFLDGAFLVDQHFKEAPFKENIPVLMALIGVWHRNFYGFSNHGVMPYDQRLVRLPAYLQQLDMESNGKSMGLSGEPISYSTGPVIWGEPGTNGQHAFFQLLHQGSDIIPVDFLVAANGFESDVRHQDILIANCFAQSEALMMGRSESEAEALLLASGATEQDAKRLAPHKTFPGNRPSNTFLYKKLDPHTLGMLIALYEHKIFVQGVVWGINSFDQMGVELGKELANTLLPAVAGSAGAVGVSAGLINAVHAKRK